MASARYKTQAWSFLLTVSSVALRKIPFFKGFALVAPAGRTVTIDSPQYVCLIKPHNRAQYGFDWNYRTGAIGKKLFSRPI